MLCPYPQRFSFLKAEVGWNTDIINKLLRGEYEAKTAKNLAPATAWRGPDCKIPSDLCPFNAKVMFLQSLQAHSEGSGLLSIPQPGDQSEGQCSADSAPGHSDSAPGLSCSSRSDLVTQLQPCSRFLSQFW